MFAERVLTGGGCPELWDRRDRQRRTPAIELASRGQPSGCRRGQVGDLAKGRFIVSVPLLHSGTDPANARIGQVTGRLLIGNGRTANAAVQRLDPEASVRLADGPLIESLIRVADLNSAQEVAFISKLAWQVGSECGRILPC